MVNKMKIGIEVKKVDSQGRFVLPSDWRESELAGVREIYVIKGPAYLKIVPKRKPDLTKFFDRIDIGVGAIGDWEGFERRFYGEIT
jgi:bifunctional DNA-binding transcriptional regulator/antitoxin component of YhaV-PrlF toxin-antitoxin module